MLRADEKTSKIVRTRRFGGDADAPAKPSQETPSGLIHDIVADTLDIAKAEGKPDETTEQRLRTNLSTLYLAAQAGLQQRTGLRTIVLSAAMALGIPVGVLAVAEDPDAAAAATAAATAGVESIASTQASHGQRITELERRADEAEDRMRDEERRARRVQALTVRWLADSQRKQCKALELIAKAIDPELEIDCDTAVLPPELVALVAQHDIEEASTP